MKTLKQIALFILVFTSGGYSYKIVSEIRIAPERKPEYISITNPNLIWQTVPKNRNNIFLETFPDSGKITIVGDTIKTIRGVFKSQKHLHEQLDSALNLLKEVYIHGYHSHFSHYDTLKLKSL